jgi:DNA polymerase III alpha subunit
MRIDAYHRRLFNEQEICDIIYKNPTVDLGSYTLENNESHNRAVQINYSDLNCIAQLPEIDIEPELWHRQNQNTWLMPESYQQLDIAQWVFEQCKDDSELQRAGAELLIYAERNLLDMLCYLKYLVDTMRENHIVWGVGRGSSVASFVLFLIGVHRINSLYYDLDFNEFMR